MAPEPMTPAEEREAKVKKPTPEMEAYALYTNMIGALSDDVLLSLRDMLKSYRHIDDADRKVIDSMREYVDVTLVSNKISNATK